MKWIERNVEKAGNEINVIKEYITKKKRGQGINIRKKYYLQLNLSGFLN